MKWLHITGILVMLLPMASAGGGTFENGMNITAGNATLELWLQGVVRWTCPEEKVCPEETAAVITDDPCGNISFTGLPFLAENGQKLSFGFSKWKDGDSVTYWVEDLRTNILKEPFMTTSSSKKSYTPKLLGEERVIIFKAERAREGCNLTMTEQSVVILGEPMVCEEPESILIIETCEEPESCTEIGRIASLYVRAKNWQENITLYGRVEEAGAYILFGEETPRNISLENGSFSVAISPNKGENTYGLVAGEGGIPLLVSFNLSFSKDTGTVQSPPVNESAQESLSGVHVITPPLLTGGVIVKQNTRRNMTVITGLTGVAGLGLAISTFKTKLLRRKHHSA